MASLSNVIYQRDFVGALRHPVPDLSGSSRCIFSRIVANKVRGSATSAIWNTTYLACLITLAPILINLSRSVASLFGVVLHPGIQHDGESFLARGEVLWYGIGTADGCVRGAREWSHADSRSSRC
jgi:hypothetical protein